MLMDNKIVQTAREIKNIDNSAKFINHLINNFCEELLPCDDKMLLDLAFSENPTQEELDNFLKNWDIEAKGGYKALMLSYFMKMHPDLKFSNYEGPRLSGLLNYYRFYNLKVISSFIKLGKVLNEAQIPFILIKGGVMKHLRPELSRLMNNIDILIPSKYMSKCINLAQVAEFVCEKEFMPNFLSLSEKNTEKEIINIHSYIDMYTGCEKKLNKLLFKRARKETVFGIEALVPCFEDILFISLTDVAKKIRNNSNPENILYTLFDCKYLLETKPDFNWDIVIENAVKTKTQVQIDFAIKFINNIIPNLLPENLQKNKRLEKETHDYCNIIIYNRFYLEPLRTVCRKIKIKHLLTKECSFAKYLKLKPKYYLMKKMKKHSAFIELFLKFNKHKIQRSNNED